MAVAYFLEGDGRPPFGLPRLCQPYALILGGCFMSL